MDGPRWWNNKLWQSTDVPVNGVRHLSAWQNSTSSGKGFDELQSHQIILEADPSTPSTLPIFQPLRVRRRSAQCFSPRGNGLKSPSERSTQSHRYSWSPRSSMGARRPIDSTSSFSTAPSTVTGPQMDRFPAPLSVIRLLTAGPKSEPQSAPFRPLGSLRVSYRPKHLQSVERHSPSRATTASTIAERRTYTQSGRPDPPSEAPKTRRTGSMLTTAFVNTKLRPKTVDSGRPPALVGPVVPQPFTSTKYIKLQQSSRTEEKAMSSTATAVVTTMSRLNGLGRRPYNDSETMGPIDIDASVRREQKSGRSVRTAVASQSDKSENYSADSQATPDNVATCKQPARSPLLAHETSGLSNKQSYQATKEIPSYLANFYAEVKANQPQGTSQDSGKTDEPKVLPTQRRAFEEFEEVINLPEKSSQAVLRLETVSTEAFINEAETVTADTTAVGMPLAESCKSEPVETAYQTAEMSTEPQLRQPPAVVSNGLSTHATSELQMGSETPPQRLMNVEPHLSPPILLPSRITTADADLTQAKPTERPKSILKKLSPTPGQEYGRGGTTSATRWLAYLTQQEAEVSAAGGAAAGAAPATGSLKSPSAGVYFRCLSSPLEISPTPERAVARPERLRDRRGVRFDTRSNSELEFNVYEASYMLDRKMARSAISQCV
ncbi:hypothetical protein AAHC03_0206 [Spirometra sp. Aus1]